MYELMSHHAQGPMCPYPEGGCDHCDTPENRTEGLPPAKGVDVRKPGDPGTIHKPILSPRQTMMRELLERIGRNPGSSKLGIVNLRYRVPTKTRARHYGMIDGLIGLGLVEDRREQGQGNAYQLHITMAGEREIYYWEEMGR